MTISSPVAFPSQVPARISVDAVSVVGLAQSPFSGSQQVYAHAAQWLEWEVEMPPLDGEDADQVVAFLLSLNGREHTFEMGDPGYSGPRGSWAGAAPKVAGGSQTGNVLVLNNLATGLTALRGDWLQVMDGAIKRLHKVVADASVGGSPLDLRLDIWPRLRSSPTDASNVTLAAPMGTFRLSENRRGWSISEARNYGISFKCREAL